ncbi:Glutamate-ammonia-ligase adenylyltransferase [Cardiobacterium hominis]|uniref:Bifunctional glutamine synthetase adenylyltransferase/adenylyl-removing enzyme n=1 Tax=Cardiobacterium hominis TaxID=2718 RepID=A0A1C3H2E1_9GAMM|nr:bifunctional [glutamate--ammonia ligase]-adenylyl-L-tyrosine phosphorylase/[glutamate--ammonia-ligase] adenylyltransferase [Cardiobacterium hominis]SAM58345.1 Glutamate-ammonia-ligase adenylyltransferase [Cardiobacterium hominis]
MTLTDRLARWQETAPADLAHRPDLIALVQASDYAAAQLARDPAIYATLDPAACPAENHRETYAAEHPHAATEDELMQQLRRYKHRRQVRHIHAVVNGLIDEAAFLARTSALAETLIRAALAWQHQALAARYGEPVDADGNPIPMLVLGMGKLGGGELNFSSDIDLIYAYRENGTTRTSGKQKPQEHESWYRKLAQRLIHTLDTNTADGNVYRVDMRLRPFGQTGPLALSFAAMEQYYLIHGRDWERYALMKARPVAGDLEGGRQLLAALRPFTYRRYLDYAALTALSDMKQSINRQIREAGIERHIKLGAGGIREAEFTVQAIQMIYGGQYPALQTPNYLEALARIGERGLWRGEQTAALREAYLTLRRVENALQYEHEQQTHQLPDDEAAWQRLALACRAPDAASLQAQIRAARDTIHQHYNSTIAEDDDAPADQPGDDRLRDIDWRDPDDPRLARWLEQTLPDAAAREPVAARLAQFVRDTNWHRLPQSTQKHLDHILPALLEHSQHNGWHGLGGLLDLITAVSGRSSYITMLAEQPALISHLHHIASRAAWLIQYIAAHPLVLDDIISERRLIPGKEALAQDLAARLQNIDDEETWQHALRDYKHVQTFKTAWADTHDKLPLMQVSDQLSHIAETTLQAALDHAEATLRAKHGTPRKADGSPAEITIIGYGKLGGLELGYSSDLDLVYIYDDGDSQGMTDGAKPIDNLRYYTRLAQRTNNLLSAASSNGIIYDIDTRLRPGGASGLPVSSIQGFARYQRENAWTWEHQALTRSRPVAGSAALAARYTALRQEILTRPPEPNLRENILAMRQKMHDNQPAPPEGHFHLKQDAGGLIDIEFIVQYLLLAHSAEEPVLCRMSDNIRQLAALEATGILTSSQAMTLRDNYRKLRLEVHHRQLNDTDNYAPLRDWQALREQVIAIWQDVFQRKPGVIGGTPAQP